ncbi:MAG TPA: DUF4307 domain-containing protein [Mycobacterium sp.]
MTDDPAALPAARYGRTRLLGRPHRWAAAALTVLVVAAGAALAVFGYQRFRTPDVSGELGGYQLIDNETVSVTISVTRSDPSRPVVCIVRARAADGSETGRREVLVGPATATTVQVTTVVKSSKPPLMGDIYGCGTEVPAYLRAPDRADGFRHS